METPFDIDPKKIYTVEEVADILKFERQTILKNIKTRHLSAYRLRGGRVYRISRFYICTR